MSRFGGRKPPRERSVEERRRAMIERERRRLGDPNWQPPSDHPLADPRQRGAQAGPQRPQTPPAQARPAQRPPSAPAARTPEPVDPFDDGGSWWDDGALHDVPQTAAWPPPLTTSPTPPPAASAAPQRPAREPVRRAAPTPPTPPTPPSAPAAASAPEPEPFDLPELRQVAVHRRRGPRTVIAPPSAGSAAGPLPGPSRRKRALIAGGALVAVLFLWSQWALWQPLKGGGTGEVVVKIPQGASASEVAHRLQEAGVVDSATLFGLRALIAGKRQDLVAGTLTMKHDMSYGAALAQLSGTSAVQLTTQSITVQEGPSIRENDERFVRQATFKDYGEAARALFKEKRSQLRTAYKMPASVKSLEGFLFPATYDLPEPLTARDLVVRQLQSFQQNLASINWKRSERANLTPYEVLIIASMVEREARLTRERPLIAAVIYNRLKAGMPLGIDATFRYASGDWTNPIRQSELDRDGPYNSRLRRGLPPTPIGNPGLASIEAAAHPSNVDYLFFVVKPNRCGEHAFSSSLDKFNADSAKYNQAREAAGGSPVTC